VFYVQKQSPGRYNEAHKSGTPHTISQVLLPKEKFYMHHLQCHHERHSQHQGFGVKCSASRSDLQSKVTKRSELLEAQENTITFHFRAEIGRRKTSIYEHSRSYDSSRWTHHLSLLLFISVSI